MGTLDQKVGELDGRTSAIEASCPSKHQKLDADVAALFESHHQNRILIERLLTWARFIGIMLAILSPVVLAEGVGVVKRLVSPESASAAQRTKP
jgi:hypothetical protein